MTQMKSAPRRTTGAKKSSQAVTDAERTLRQIEETLAPIISEMQSIIRDQAEGNLRAWREIGRIFLQNRQTIESARFAGQIGKVNPFDVFARRIGYDERKLRFCANFAASFDDELLDMAIAARLNWSHIVLLVSLSTRESCVSYINQIVEHNWTGKDLANALMQSLGNRREGSGRRHDVPRSLSTGLSKALKASGQFRRVLGQSLFCDEFHVAEAVFLEPPDEVTEMTAKQLHEAIEAMEAIVTTLGEHIPRLREAVDHVEGRLAARQMHQPLEAAGIVADSGR